LKNWAEWANSGGEPIRSLNDRLWWKCKTADLRAIVTKLSPAKLAALGLPELAAWWGGAAGVRRDDSASDFYRQLQAEEGGEAYLAIAAEGFIQPRMIALILSSVPGISGSDWQAEPGGVTDIKPKEGQIIWSTMIQSDIQARILEVADAAEQDH